MKNYKQNNCCNERSILEKILIVVVILMIFLLIAIFTVFVLHMQKVNKNNVKWYESLEKNHAAYTHSNVHNKTEKISVCMTHHCVQAASQIIDFLDFSADPCEDFYTFVCGGFLNKSTSSNEITPLSKFEGITLNQLDALITEPVAERIPKSWELQRKYYKMCMDTQAIEDDNTYTFSNLIKQLGDWPVLHGRFWDERKFNWLKSMTECRKIGFGYEHFMGISAFDASNVTEDIILSITPPAVIQLPYQVRELYIDIMANISIEMGAPSYLAKNEFIRVYKFEEEIKMFAEDEKTNGQEQILSVAQLQENYPSIPWLHFLSEMTRTSAPFTEQTLVHLRAGRYLVNLLNLLERTPKSIQANYVVWKIIENFRSYLKESIRGRYESFLVLLNPDYAFATNRHTYCLNKAKFYFPSVAELAYVRKYLDLSKRQDIKNITEKIKKQLISKVKKNQWMDEMSKNISINTLNQVQEHIGSSDEAYYDDFDKIVEMDGFDLSTDNILEMATKLYAKRADNYFKTVNKNFKDVTKEVLEKSPVLSINAFYNRDFNSLIMPAPFLQGVIYNFQRPQYMNYGALGSVIGHELTHGFIVDRNETKRYSNQWTTYTKTKYEEKAQCILNEYESYNGHLKEFTKDARSVLEENIADLVGPDLAYQAYQERVRALGKEPLLPSLPFTQNQIFWIMSGIFRCYQPKFYQNMKFDQHHAVPSFTVSFSVKNSPSFAQDFSCPVDSTMNPSRKCKIL